MSMFAPADNDKETRVAVVNFNSRIYGDDRHTSKIHDATVRRKVAGLLHGCSKVR